MANPEGNLKEELEERDNLKRPTAELRKLLLLAIGTGGSKITVDLINKSKKLCEKADSIYFLDTDANPRLTIPDKIKESVKSKLDFIYKPSDREETNEENIPVTFIEYGGGRGAGRDFVRSEICATEFLIPSELKEGISGDELKISDEDKSNIINMWDDLDLHNIIILVHTLGGGTGGGSAPIIAREIKNRLQGQNLRRFVQNTTVISLCFLASKSETPLLNANSVRNLMEISKHVDIVLLFSNTNLAEYTEKTRHLFGDELKGLQDIKNLHVCRVLDILLSSNHDFNDFRNIITEPGVTNIVLPHISMKNERIPPLSEIDALKYPMAKIFESTLIKAMPLFIGSDPRMSSSFAQHSSEYHRGFFDNTENYKQWIVGKLKPRMQDIAFGELEPIFDEECNRLDTLILTACAVDLSENLGKNNINLEQTVDFWRTKIGEGSRYWRPKLSDPDLDAEDIKDDVVEWHEEYLEKFEKRIEEFNKKGGMIS
ncbi:MAG: hypothetical protein PVF58_14010 [Candidatus Methanofastidiosia archaeon]|jgi:hypothetical protein